MSSYTGFSPKSPNRYLGPNLYLSTVVTRNRSPTGADYRQPENGKLYPIASYWIVGKDPTTGTEGDLWYLAKIAANVAYWVMLSAGVGNIEEFTVDSVTAPGVNPVSPNAGLIDFNGRLVPAQGIPVQSYTIALNQMGIEAQIGSAVAASDITQNGLSHYNSAQFTQDADGFVSLVGGSGGVVQSVNVDANTPPGTDPVLPNGSGVITVTGAQAAAGTVGTNVLRTVSLAANTYTIQIQRSTAVAGTDSANNGVSHYDSAAFDVDANGFVQLNGGGVAATSFDVQANTVPGTDPVVPTALGVVTVNGAAVANHAVVLETRSRAANAYNLEVQYATTAASSTANLSGVCHFNSAQFSVDGNGFVSINNTITQWLDVSGALSAAADTGYFVTGTCTATLPASPSQGDTIKFVVDTTNILTITANTGQVIRQGNNASSTAGTAVSSQRGDSMDLVYRAANATWWAETGPNGAWIYA